MAISTKRLQPVRVERVLPRLALHWRDVIAFQASGLAAHHAAVGVTLEHKAAHSGPAVGIQAGVVSAQVRLSVRFPKPPPGGIGLV